MNRKWKEKKRRQQNSWNGWINRSEMRSWQLIGVTLVWSQNSFLWLVYNCQLITVDVSHWQINGRICRQKDGERSKEKDRKGDVDAAIGDDGKKNVDGYDENKMQKPDKNNKMSNKSIKREKSPHQINQEEKCAK